ncbi:MAG: glycine dehydrogenase (aminomethyl-transferring), partial [Proteiniphilum sp.]|nr:glycine dehydrogenase (aminomethyl-transferring) [Proteiniphilum sp.]
MLKMEQFKNRHIGLSEADKKIMLKSLGIQSIEELIDQTIPADIRLSAPLSLPSALSEQEYAEEIAQIASQNKLFASYIGMGWYDTITPAAIYRNVFENPVWYTSYTPYQAEISQGRLEALLNFQTMVSELTALPLANCSLLDEATAAAEAATMMHGLRSREQVKEKVETLFVDERIFPQTLSVLKTRMHYTGIEIVTGDWRSLTFDRPLFGMILQYPDGEGSVEDYRELVKKAHEADCKVAVATDLMALVLLTPPGEWGADIAFGSSQRFGIPMFYGGPSAAFFATKEEYKRSMPGRIIGISKDAQGREAYRMALQTREQHIKREKATSNICTAQALLATMSSFYAVYHGPEGLKEIARRIHAIASHVSEELKEMGFKQLNKSFFDTLKVALPEGITVQDIRENAEMRSINLRYYPSGEIGISIDETTNNYRVHELLAVFAMAAGSSKVFLIDDLPEKISLKESQLRKTDFLAHPTFHLYHTETELMRYIKRLERKDISLAHSMISLGSCTMKLNAASELLPLGMPGLQRMHPFVPEEQAVGYRQMIDELEEMLAEITGFAATSLQPNSGAAGEYTGLITIGAYLESKGEAHRKVVLI